MFYKVTETADGEREEGLGIGARTHRLQIIRGAGISSVNDGRSIRKATVGAFR